MGRFDVAQRESLYGKTFIYSGAGGGKTVSALRFARGMVGPRGRIHVLDTESKSARHYLGRFGGPWSHESMMKDFNPERYIECIVAAYRDGIDCLIIDSITHAWRGPGGVLDIVEKAAKRYGGNSFAGWKVGRPAHTKLMEAIQKVPMHVIVTCRAKMGYEVVTDKTNGKKRPEKVGMAPIQDDAIEYEFDLSFLLDEQHTAITSKDRSGVFEGRRGTITEEDGEAFAAYLEGRELPYGYEIPVSAPVPAKVLTKAELDALAVQDAEEALRAAQAELEWARKQVGDSSSTSSADVDDVVEVDTANMGAIDTPTQAPETITVAGVEVVALVSDTAPKNDDAESPADAAGLTEGAAEMGIEPWASDMACDTLEELFAEIGVTDSDDVWRRLVKAEMAAGRRLITPENAEEACTRIRTKIEQMQATK